MVKEYAEKLLSDLPELDPDIEVVNLNGKVDHVHMVVIIPRKYAVARVVQFFKSQSAKGLKSKRPFAQKVYFLERLWFRGYCVSCISLDEKEIHAYV